jgi:integrase
MPRKHRRVRVEGERNLYLVGEEYWACATPEGGRQAQWLKIGRVGVMEARRRRDEFVAAVRRGQVPLSRRTKVREVAELYLGECEQLVEIGALAPSTLASYRLGLNTHFLPDYGNRTIASLTADDLVRWHRKQQRAEAAAWTIRARWTAVRGLLVYATRHQLIATNPADILTRRERPSPGESRLRFLDEDEMRALLDATPTRFRAAVATMLFTGLRAGEALGLVWADVDFKGQRVLVRFQMGRGGKRVRLKSKGAAREVILIERLAEILREHKAASPWSGPDDLVFTSTVGTSMTYRRLSQAIRRATTDAGLGGVSAHVLRHTFASVLIYQGRDVAFVARQLGHTTPSTTWDTYVHLFNEAKQADQAREELNAEFGPVLDTPNTARRADAAADGEPTAADRIAALQADGGLSGSEIARMLGTTKSTVSYWRSAKGSPRRHLADRLLELQQLVADLAASRPAHSVRAWLLAPHPGLTGERPADLIRAGAIEEVARVAGQASNRGRGNKQGASRGQAVAATDERR